MYHLAKSLYLHATSKEEYSILLLGLDNAGKSTLLEQIKALPSSLPSPSSSPPYQPKLNTVPTVGQNVATVLQGHPPAYLKIWDVGGQHTLRGLWEKYYDVCHGIVFVLDSSDLGDGDLSSSSSSLPSSLFPVSHAGLEDQNPDPDDEDTGRLKECARTLAAVLAAPALASVPVLVLANKQDRGDSLEVVRIKEGFVRRVVESERVGAKVRDSRVLPCSALTGEGVREAVEWLGSRVRWNKEGRAPVWR